MLTKYYLDTSIIYNLKRVPERAIHDSYTSFLAILEIVAGINSENFQKRKAALNALLHSELFIDWRTPDMIINDSFTVYHEYKMSDKTVDFLRAFVGECVSAVSYSQIASMQINRVAAIEYFRAIDSLMTKKFTDAFSGLVPAIKKSALTHSFQLGELTIDVNFTNPIKANFITEEKYRSFIRLLATSSKNIIANSAAREKPEYPLEDVVASYNGGVDFFICVWLTYISNNIGAVNTPGRNDFQDIVHFIYLRNYLDKKIVSNDNLHGSLATRYRLTLEELINAVAT